MYDAVGGAVEVPVAGSKGGIYEVPADTIKGLFLVVSFFQSEVQLSHLMLLINFYSLSTWSVESIMTILDFNRSWNWVMLWCLCFVLYVVNLCLKIWWSTSKWSEAMKHIHLINSDIIFHRNGSGNGRSSSSSLSHNRSIERGSSFITTNSYPPPRARSHNHWHRQRYAELSGGRFWLLKINVTKETGTNSIHLIDAFSRSDLIGSWLIPPRH